MMRAWLYVLVACAVGVCGCQLLHKQNREADAGSAVDGGGPSNAAGEVSGSGPSTLPQVPPLAAEPVHKHAGSRCAAKEVAILLGPGEEACVTECKSSATCAAGWACDGEGVLSNGGKAGPAIAFCRIGSRMRSSDGGAAPFAPAFAADAGGLRSEPPERPDAGAPKRLDVKRVGAACPNGYRACGVACRLACTRDTDCGLSTAHCQAGMCLGPGAKACP